MAQTDFTPGPWRVARHTTKVSVYADTMARPHAKSPIKGGLVASMMTAWNSVQAERALADANLIAAAPELYAACELAREFIQNGAALGYIRMPDPEVPDKAHTTLPAILAALAKARGEVTP